jgi:CcmD family protein
MEATNAELYKLALHDAPYVIAAYAVLWVALIGYVTIVLRRIMRLEKEVLVVEESLERRG